LPGIEDWTDNVEEPEPPAVNVTCVGVSVAEEPAGEIVSCNVTVPVNPLRLVSVIAVEFDEPESTVSEAWPEEIEKSGATVTVTSTNAVWIRPAFVAVRVAL
jgi:hypothetical protein